MSSELITKKDKKDKKAAFPVSSDATSSTPSLSGDKPSKKHKKRKHVALEETDATNVEAAVDASEAKSKKKKSKTSPPEATVDSANATPMEVDVPAQADEQSDEQAKKEKKEKKKEKKRLAALASASATPTPTLVDESNIPTAVASEADDAPLPSKKVKKDKKAKKEKEPSEAASAVNPTQNEPSATSQEATSFLKENNITIDSPHGPLTPALTFDQLSLTPDLRKALGSFTKPTPIQSCAWPALFAGHDVVGIAETGSGKTLAFGLPALSHMTSDKGKSASKDFKGKGSNISILVVAPTRELAIQTHETLSSIGAPFGILSVCLYGGVDKGSQRKLLANPKCRIVVGTPGRLKDLAEEGVCDLSRVTYLVLDEADRMLDKGFENDITNIIGQCAPSASRQTLMFSATWPDSVRRLADSFQRTPVRITVGNDELTANKRVTQSVDVFEDPRAKDRKLHHLLKTLEHTTSKDQQESRILIFVLYKKEADRVLDTLQYMGYTAGAIHGDLSQDKRLKALEDFKTGKTGLLVATDVAARGLDIPNVGSVINYSFPLTVEDYIHRIGRTGRGGAYGKSFTFFTGEKHERALAGEYAKVLTEAGFESESVKLHIFPMTIKKKEHGAYGAFFRDTSGMGTAKKIKFS